MALKHTAALRTLKAVIQAQAELQLVNPAALRHLRCLGTWNSLQGPPRPPSFQLSIPTHQQDGPSTSLSTNEVQLFLAFHRRRTAHALVFQRDASFFRFLSQNAQRLGNKLKVPNATDCDEALEDYIALQNRLEKIKRPSTIRSWDQSLKDVAVGLKNGTVAVFRFTVSVPGRIQAFMAMPKDVWDAKKAKLWQTIKHEAHHYWVGTKLLSTEVKIASRYAIKALRGHELTRRERAQLTRTSADLFRLVPFIIIVVIPFMELALPLLLKLFPNMLPSTYEDKLKKEEELKRRLGIKLELARFLQDTMAEMAKDVAKKKGNQDQAKELFEFLKKVRSGEPVENHDIIKVGQLFNDEFTLDNLERLQLVSMCQFVGISPFGSNQFLASRLRAHLLQIKKDDYAIEREGIENLTEEELRAACRARGMRAPFGPGAAAFMRRQLQDWVDLSLHRGLPSSLLLMSRMFTITASVQDVAAKKDLQYSKLKETLSVIPEEVVETVASEALGGAGLEALQKRLEFLKREEAAIKDELARAKLAAAKDATAKTAAAVEPAQAVDPVSAEELAVAEQEERERKIAAIVSSLMDLASSSGVAKERSMFMGLMKKEIDRVNNELTDKSGKKGTMNFGIQGLEVTSERATDCADTTSPGTPTGAEPEPEVSQRLSERVNKLLASIERELDSVETKIGNRMHVLDRDNDGVVSLEELQTAIQFLRDQLPPEELQQLLQRLGAAATSTASAQGSSEQPKIQMAELLTLAAEKSTGAEAKDKKASEPAQDVVQIHTR